MIIILIGESGAGKSSIEKELVNKYNYEKIVSYTTRPPRPDEKDGVDYKFLNDDEFDCLHESDFFAETSDYNGWKYGTAWRDYEPHHNHKVVVLTPNGMRRIKFSQKIETICFYISVPRRDRLIAILQRGDDIEEAYRRNLSDVGQFDGVEHEADYIFYNDGYTKTVGEAVKEIVTNTCILAR